MRKTTQQAANAMFFTVFLTVGVHAQQSTTRAGQTPAPIIPPTNYGVPINIDQARQVAAAADSEAQKHNAGAGVTMAIVDAGGDIVYAQKGSGANVAAMDIALAKARSSAFYGSPTRAFYELLKKGTLNQSLNLPSAAAMGPGGLPILVDGRIVGAIGVTGGDDEEIAAAGRRALDPKAPAVEPAAQLPQAAQATLYGISVDPEQVKRIIAATDAEARKRNIASYTMVIADTNGELVYAQKALGARRAVMEIALEKARSSARYGISSKSFTERLVAGDLTGSLALPGAATMGSGGVPIVVQGRIVGGMAVAGVWAVNDVAIAEAGAAALD